MSTLRHFAVIEPKAQSGLRGCQEQEGGPKKWRCVRIIESRSACAMACAMALFTGNCVIQLWQVRRSHVKFDKNIDFEVMKPTLRLLEQRIKKSGAVMPLEHSERQRPSLPLDPAINEPISWHYSQNTIHKSCTTLYTHTTNSPSSSSLIPHPRPPRRNRNEITHN